MRNIRNNVRTETLVTVFNMVQDRLDEVRKISEILGRDDKGVEAELIMLKMDIEDLMNQNIETDN